MNKQGFLAAVAAVALVGGCLDGPAIAESQDYVVRIHPVGKSDGFEKLHLSKAALAGSEISLWANTAINPDCTLHPPGATLAIVTPPEHGSARISDDPLYIAFPPNNPRSACNKQKVPGHEAFYAASAGYTGHDRVVLQGSSPEGRVRRIIVDIEVR